MPDGKRDPRRVLVLDGDQGASLAIVRSLGRFGMTVDAGERRRRFLASYSRHVEDAITYPDPLADPGGFVRTIEERVSAKKYELVIPVTEDTVQPLAASRERIERHAKLAIAPSEALETMTDKRKTFELAARLGVPVPASWTFTSLADLENASKALPYPVVVKPSRSIANGAGGKNEARAKLSVAYAHDPSELVALSRPALATGGSVIVQEYFRGSGVGVEVLADRGEIIYAFQHKRLHELPLTGGGSCLRESMPVNPVLLEHAKRLIAATKWHGVAMIEFKLDEATHEARLMEVNGRFWGSLPLAVAAGADFPRFLLELYAEGKRPDPSRDAAKIGVVSRKLSDDVYWYVQVLKPDQDEPLIEWPTRGRMVRDALLGLSPSHHFDVQSIDDVRPGFVDAFRTGKWFVERFGSTARAKAVELQQRIAQRTGRARSRVESAGEILFVCYGNINRSILAERHLASALKGVASTIEIRSAGFHQEEGRPADPAMIREAAHSGLSLDGASSRVLDARIVDRADVIFAMEVKHLLRLHDEYPSTRRKAFLLSTVSAGDVPLEISDPYGRSEAEYARCFREVTACTRAIADTLTRRRGHEGADSRT
jgi:predicted ATP-grasp superfamily ATP-dependent carboligase/protein-tyrosine-phosphatase